jgi:hypothetical protein
MKIPVSGNMTLRERNKLKQKFCLFVYIQIQFLPHSKHCVSSAETKQLMLSKELIAVCCENILWSP